MTVVSIDLWRTLIKSSPFFRQEKKVLVKKYFPHVTDDEIDVAFEKTKKQLNNVIFITGWQPDEIMITTLLFHHLDPNNDISFNQKLNFHTEYQLLAIFSPPVFYSNDTLVTLLKMSKEFELILSSNTMFITGSTFIDILHSMQIVDCFKHFNFSDIIKLAKPNKAMYGNSEYHIGDNDITDGKGPINHGIKSIIINSNNNTLLDAYNLIKEDKKQNK